MVPKVGGKSPGCDSLAGGSLVAMMPFVVTCGKPSKVQEDAGAAASPREPCSQDAVLGTQAPPHQPQGNLGIAEPAFPLRARRAGREQGRDPEAGGCRLPAPERGQASQTWSLQFPMDPPDLQQNMGTKGLCLLPSVSHHAGLN